MKIQWTPNEFCTGVLWGVIISVLLGGVSVLAILWTYIGIVLGQTLDHGLDNV